MANKGGNPQNLIHFKKGDPKINRKGRPPVLPELKDVLTKILNKRVAGKNGKGSKILIEAVLTALASKALKGDTRAAQEILDRVYGKVSQTLNHNIGEGGIIINQPGFEPLKISTENKDIPPESEP